MTDEPLFIIRRRLREKLDSQFDSEPVGPYSTYRYHRCKCGVEVISGTFSNSEKEYIINIENELETICPSCNTTLELFDALNWKEE